MSQFTYSVPAGRINRMLGEIIAHAVPIEVLGTVGMNRQIPKNKGATVIYRSYLPWGATTTNANTQNRPAADPNLHMLQEGVTPPADTLVPRDVSATLQQFGVLYGLTDKTVDLYEDDIPPEMIKQAGERIGLVREMIRYGVLKGGTNAFYQGGTSRAAVNGRISLAKLRKISRNLNSNHAKQITSVLSMSYDFGSTGVEAAYCVYAHTDLASDIRDLPNFKSTVEYAQRKLISPQEIGSCEEFRFILSPELAPYADAGAAIGATGMFSTTGANIDVYPVLVMGMDAFGNIALRGDDAVDPTYIPPNVKSAADPLGQRGYVGAKFYAQSLMLNQGWMAVLEVGITDL